MTETATPSVDKQRLDALRRANAIRSRRATFKKQMAAAVVNGNGNGRVVGREIGARALTTVPSYLETQAIGPYLAWLPGMGRVKARNICRKWHISTTRAIGTLPPNLRRAIAAEIS